MGRLVLKHITKGGDGKSGLRSRSTRYEAMPRCESADVYLRMVGCGRASVAEVCEISRANVADGASSAALHGLKSLGGEGRHESNQERDLHRWVKGLHSMQLEPFHVEMLLNVPGKVDPVRQQVPVLLPHEILDAVWHAGDAQAASKGLWPSTGMADYLAFTRPLSPWKCVEGWIALTFKCFTVANTGLEKTTEYPEMGSCFKAAFMKAACWFFTKMAIQLANAHPHDEILRLTAVCLWNLHSALCLLDESDILLCEDDAKDFSNHVEIHLIAWQHLAAICQDQSLRLFKLRPKHHSCDHMGTQVARTKVNPRKAMQCFGDESFLGFWKRIGVKCHSTSILRRIYQRYLLFLSLRWRDAKAGS